MSIIRRHRAVLAVAGGALALRLVLAYIVFPDQGLATDLGFFASWARTLAQSGPGSFYATASSANYPPAYPYILWLIGLLANPLAAISGGTPDQAIVALLKLPAIAADIGVGLLLYRAGSRWLGVRGGLVAAALYLFIPVTWYDSALWGQVDAIGALAMLGALVLLVDGWSEGAAALGAFSVLVKPQDGIVLFVIAPVLVRRHLLRPGSGPMPAVRGRLARIIDRGLDGVLHESGPIRLGTSALAAALALILPLLPFDIFRLGPASLADVPVVGHVAGLISLVLSASSQFSVLTVNAFNPWALVGPQPLAAVMGGAGTGWTPDSLAVLAGIPAWLFSAGLLAAAGLVVAAGLLRRDGWVPVFLGFTILALAFYLLPTRVHERYLFPFFASGALLAAAAARWLAGFVGVGLLNAVNIHVVLGAPLAVGFGPGAFGGGFGGGRGDFGGGRPGGFGGSAGLISDITLPFAQLLRSEVVVTAVAIGQAAALAGLLGAWAILVLRPVRVARNGPLPSAPLTPARRP